MKTEMKVLLYLKKNEQSADDPCSVMGKITVKGESNSVAQFGSKLKVTPKLWNATSQRCTGKSHAAITVNREIESMLLLLRSRFNELTDAYKTVTALDVKNAFQGIASEQATLLSFFKEHNDEFALRVGVNRAYHTCYAYRNVRRLVTEFITTKYKVSDLTLRSLDYTFIEGFDLFLRVNKRQKPKTILMYITNLKTVVTKAVNKGIIDFNPFLAFSPEKQEHKHRHLTEDELTRLMSTTLDTPSLNFTRDMFLFSCFTGLAFCDMCKLSESEIKSDKDGNLWIETTRQKTGIPENVMLLPIAIQLMERYKASNKAGILFPMPSNKSTNADLKKIATQCSINRNLTFHMARHTFATQTCLRNGMPIETVCRAMGHVNISTTQLYATVTHEKIDQDISALSTNIAGKYTLQGVDTAPKYKSRPKRANANRESL